MQSDGEALKNKGTGIWTANGGEEDSEAENSLDGAADGGQDAAGGPQPLML